MATTKIVRKDNKPEVPAIVLDPDRKSKYEKGCFLGKGGFAHCYEFLNVDTKEVVAGKVVPKHLLVKQYQRDKMAQEVQIHRNLVHKNVVKLFNFFEDTANVYITLELCSRRSLMELHKRRKSVTEPEARYFTLQIVEGVLYLHGLNIIHRDLKLGNLFLNDELQVKIGDFGLATVVATNEMKKTLCGTPNYIAPEVLSKKGHSFEVDIWAIGCILYILLFGTPPFESKSLEETYSRIKNNEYKIPTIGSTPASRLIQKMLNSDPGKRPTAKQINRDPFFKSGFLPTRLPVSCLTMAPKFATDSSLMTENQPPSGFAMQRNLDKNDLAVLNNRRNDHVPIIRHETTFKEDDNGYLPQLYEQVASLVNQKIRYISDEDAAFEDYQSPECKPIFWISKWVDYSDKYGIGYQLCDNSIGVLFNDRSRIVLDEAGYELTYIEQNNQEYYYCLKNHQIPSGLNKKVTLVKYFRSYMNDHLVAAGEGADERIGDELARLPTLRVWFRTKSAIVLHLSNGIVQINFFADHIKMMICPHMQSVTFIDTQKRMLTFTFENLKANGCPENYMQRLKYAEKMIARLIATSEGVTNSQPSEIQQSNNANPTHR